MALGTNWSWNLVFLFVCFCWFSRLVLVTHWPFLVYMCMLKVLFRHSETTHKLETNRWPRRNACFQKWCFPTTKQPSFWKVASRLGETLCFNIRCATNWVSTANLFHIYIYTHTSLPLSLYIYIYIFMYMYIYIYIYVYTCICINVMLCYGMLC